MRPIALSHASGVAALGIAEHSELDDALIDAVAARLLDRVAERVVAALREDGLLLAPSAGNERGQLTLADAHGTEELAVDSLRHALGATEVQEEPPANAIVWDLTS